MNTKLSELSSSSDKLVSVASGEFSGVGNLHDDENGKCGVVVWCVV